MPKNYIESVCDEFEKKFIMNHGEAGKTLILHNDLGELTVFLKSSLESLLRKAMEGMPEEIIVHEYMGTNHPRYDNKACAAWNDYRTHALASLQALGAKEV
jgi:hypothetical protein